MTELQTFLDGVRGLLAALEALKKPCESCDKGFDAECDCMKIMHYASEAEKHTPQDLARLVRIVEVQAKTLEFVAACGAESCPPCMSRVMATLEATNRIAADGAGEG